MERADLLALLAGRVAGLELNLPARVAVTGIDAAGKTTMADELAAVLSASGPRGRPRLGGRPLHRRAPGPGAGRRLHIAYAPQDVVRAGLHQCRRRARRRRPHPHVHHRRPLSRGGGSGPTAPSSATCDAYEEFDDIMAALLVEVVFTRDFAIGEHHLTVPRLVAHLATDLARALPDLSSSAPARNLNQYIEAQVHGPVSLADDVNALVVDPSFQGTATGDRLAELSARYDIALSWHRGFSLPPA